VAALAAVTPPTQAAKLAPAPHAPKAAAADENAAAVVCKMPEERSRTPRVFSHLPIRCCARSTSSRRVTRCPAATKARSAIDTRLAHSAATRSFSMSTRAIKLRRSAISARSASDKLSISLLASNTVPWPNKPQGSPNTAVTEEASAYFVIAGYCTPSAVNTPHSSLSWLSYC
jgi:hypothetical protein